MATLIAPPQADRPPDEFDHPQAVPGAMLRAAGLTRDEIERSTGLPTAVLSAPNKLRGADAASLSRVQSALASAIKLFEGRTDEAVQWLRTPRPALGDQAPLHLAATDDGLRRLEDYIFAVENGVFL